MKAVLTTLQMVFLSIPIMGDEVTKSTFEDIKVRAEKGEAVDQLLLGKLYARGVGVPQDFKMAAKWFRKSAEQGNADAQYSLGAMFDQGDGLLEDDKNAIK